MRHLVVLTLIGTAVACDPAIGGGFVVAPQPVPPPDTVRGIIRGVTSHIAESHAFNHEGGGGPDEWQECFRKERFRMCWRLSGSTAEIRMWEFPAGRWGDAALNMQRELLDSLTARWGGAAVRRCEWLWKHDRRAGAPVRGECVVIDSAGGEKGATR